MHGKSRSAWISARRLKPRRHAAARTLGFGGSPQAMKSRVEAMRKTMDAVQRDGTIVIGEGERDESAYALHWRKGGARDSCRLRRLFPEVDIEVGSWRAPISAPTGGGAIVCCRSDKGGCFTRPIYHEKIVVGLRAKCGREIDATVADHLKSIAKRLDRYVEDLVIMFSTGRATKKLIAEHSQG